MHIQSLYAAPSQSFLTALFDKVNNLYHCTIEVNSIFGPFTAMASNVDAARALEIVEWKLLEKLRRWNKNRFQLRYNEFINDYSRKTFDQNNINQKLIAS